MDTLNLLAMALVLLTGAENFRMREGATAWLNHAWPWTSQAVLRGQRDECHEVRYRCQWVVDENGDRAVDRVKIKLADLQRQVDELAKAMEAVKAKVNFVVEKYRPACGYFPWIEPEASVPAGLERELTARKYVALAYAKMENNWPAYPVSSEATRLWILDMVLEGMTEAHIRATLESLWESHRAWCKQLGHKVPD